MLGEVMMRPPGQGLTGGAVSISEATFRLSLPLRAAQQGGGLR